MVSKFTNMLLSSVASILIALNYCVIFLLDKIYEEIIFSNRGEVEVEAVWT